MDIFSPNLGFFQASIYSLVPGVDSDIFKFYLNFQVPDPSLYAAWKDRNGDIQEHFTNNDTNVCNCHQNQSCFSVMPNINYCNCDTGDIVQREDTMRITNKVNSVEHEQSMCPCPQN